MAMNRAVKTSDGYRPELKEGLMTVKQAANELGVSISTIYKLMNTRELPYLQIGRRRLPTDQGVMEFKAKNTVAAIERSIPSGSLPFQPKGEPFSMLFSRPNKQYRKA